jgi:hypothetical protein
MASKWPMALLTTVVPLGTLMEGMLCVWWWGRAKAEDRREERETRTRRKGRAEPPSLLWRRRLPPLGRSILLVVWVAVWAKVG